jgi:hypothetical protein
MQVPLNDGANTGMMSGMRLLVVFVFLFLLVSCSSSNPNASPTSTGEGGHLSTAGPTGAAARPAASPTTKPRDTTSAGRSNRINGYGAMWKDWLASHYQARGFAKGGAFGPMLPGNQPKYAGVAGDPGERVLSYSMYLPEGTSFAEAQRQVLAEFPRGAKFGVTDNQEARCRIQAIRSRKVEKYLEGYIPLVGYFSGADEDFRTSNVEYVSMLLTEPDDHDLGDC